MRPALALYAEYLEGNGSAELAQRYGLRHKTVLMMLAGARLSLNHPKPFLLPEEARRFHALRYQSGPVTTAEDCDLGTNGRENEIPAN